MSDKFSWDADDLEKNVTVLHSCGHMATYELSLDQRTESFQRRNGSVRCPPCLLADEYRPLLGRYVLAKYHDASLGEDGYIAGYLVSLDDNFAAMDWGMGVRVDAITSMTEICDLFSCGRSFNEPCRFTSGPHITDRPDYRED